MNSTSPRDRTVLVQWIFGVTTLHPDLDAMASISGAQRTELSRKAGVLFQKLLLDSCRPETRQENRGAR